MSNKPRKNNDKPSFEDLLRDIETEESKVAEQFPSIADAFDDDLDDLDLPEDDLREETPDTVFDDDLDDDLDDAPDDAPAEVSDEPEYEPPDSDYDEDESLSDVPDGDWPPAQNWRNSRYLPFVVIGLLVIIIILLLAQNCGGANKGGDESWYDSSAIEGSLPGKTPEEIEAMLNQIVEEGMFNISIAPVIVFENAQAQGQARIENVPANHYNMSVSISLDQTGETIYESKGIRPGQYIEYITLQKELSPGEYDATAMFTAYDAENLSKQGQVAVKITIIVE